VAFKQEENKEMTDNTGAAAIAEIVGKVVDIYQDHIDEGDSPDRAKRLAIKAVLRIIPNT
jgi:hypothetical protein